MKTRSGFVSNSSSSSFALILKEDDYAALVSKASPLAQSVAAYIGGENGKLGDIVIRAISWMEGNSSTLECFDIEDNKPFIQQWINEHAGEFDYIDVHSDECDQYELYDVVRACWEDFVKQACVVGFKVETDC